MKLYNLTLQELNQFLLKKEITKEEIVESLVSRINEVDKVLNAFITVFDKDQILSFSSNSQLSPSQADNSQLSFIPIAIKDNICIKGTKTTCGSKILSNYVAPYNATVIDLLVNSGVSILGKTNMDEFAMGSSTETSYFGPTKNPYDITRIPGGSSGGSAVAVASGETPTALGSDTGGSIRQPAALCGVVGFKPTYGRVSRYGLVAFASSLDQIGVFARTVYDTAMILEIICKYDEKDSTSINIPEEKYSQELDVCDEKNLKGIKIGLPKEYFIEGIQEEIKTEIMKSVRLLESYGAEIVEVSLPNTEYAVATYYIIAPSEASSNLARYDGVKYGFKYKKGEGRMETEEGKSISDETKYSTLIDMCRWTRKEGFGNEVKRRIMLGTYSLSSGYYDAYYGKAQRVRNLITQDFINIFEKVDVIITPTTPTTAFKLGEKVNDPLQMYLSDIFTIPCNLAGLPGVSVPCGYDKNGLPIGMQILASHLNEMTILKLAYLHEKLKKIQKVNNNPYIV